MVTQTCKDNARSNRKEFVQICPKCGKEFIVIGTQREFDKGKLRRFCSRACANTRIHSNETKQKTSCSVSKYYENHEFPKGFYEPIKTYYCKQCGKPFTMKDDRDTNSRKYCCNKCKKIWLKNNLEITFGGYGCKSGRSRSGWYKGIYCASTWELAFLIYHLDHNIDIKRCKEKRTYIFNGGVHSYYPDFIVNNQIIEIKGQNNPQWEAKYKYNPDIKVLFHEDMKPYLNYIKTQYKLPIVELYDTSDSRSIITDKSGYWVNNGIEQKWVSPDQLSNCLNDGWIKGRLEKALS